MNMDSRTVWGGVAGGALVLVGQYFLGPAREPAAVVAPVTTEAAVLAEPAVIPAPVLLGDLPPGTVILTKSEEGCPEGWTLEPARIVASNRGSGGGVMIVVGGENESASYYVCANG